VVGALNVRAVARRDITKSRVHLPEPRIWKVRGVIVKLPYTSKFRILPWRHGA
jgi:hypothetical protein